VNGHVYLDETKRHSYLVAAAFVLPAVQDELRRVVRGLVLPGQRRLHMKDERDSRKRAIAAALVAAGVQATVYDAGVRYSTERLRRAACLQGVVQDAAGRGDTLLVLEQDDSLVSWDSQQLIELTRAAGCRDTLHYVHRRAADEPLLAIPDAIAWCWAKGGDWRRRIAPTVSAVRSV